MEKENMPQWLTSLEEEDLAFIKNFILTSGSLKEISALYEVSYPTVRLRLDKLIQKIRINDRQEEEPFTAFIKRLAVDDKLDLDTAKQIINQYKKSSSKNGAAE